MDSVIKFVQENSGVITTIGSVVLMFVAKMVPNSNAGPLVSKLQGGIDTLAKVVAGAGLVLAAISKVLSDILKSDGILGKK